MINTKTLFFVMLHILPFVLGKCECELVLNQIVNNKETPVRNKTFHVSAGETLQFHCYVNITLKSRNYQGEDVSWQIPRNFVQKNVKINGSVLTVQGTYWRNSGHYVCLAQNILLYGSLSQDFYVNVPRDNYNIVNDFVGKTNFIQPLSYFTPRPIPQSTEIPQMKIPVSSYSSYGMKNPSLLYVLCVFIALIGLSVYCNIYPKRFILHIPKSRCNHQICVNHRIVNPSCHCLMENFNPRNNKDVYPTAIPLPYT